MAMDSDKEVTCQAQFGIGAEDFSEKEVNQCCELGTAMVRLVLDRVVWSWLYRRRAGEP